MRFPTGGTAHEPQGMIRCDSGADSTVWMREDIYRVVFALGYFHILEFFIELYGHLALDTFSCPGFSFFGGKRY